MKTTAPEVAKLFNVPLENVKALYAKNAISLQADAKKASKTGKLRGLSVDWYLKAAQHAKAQSL